jgi:hypothetical protein
MRTRAYLLVVFGLLFVVAMACGKSNEEKLAEEVASAFEEIGVDFQDAFGPAFPRGDDAVDSSPKSSVGSPLAVSTSANLRSDGFEFNVTITDVLRGDAAFAMAHDESSFASVSLDDGEELLVFKTSIEVVSSNEDDPIQIDSGLWSVVSSGGIVYKQFLYLGGNASPELDFKVLPGGTVDGWVQFTISTDDDDPVAGFGTNSKLRGGAWFDLTPTIKSGTGTLAACKEFMGGLDVFNLKLETIDTADGLSVVREEIRSALQELHSTTAELERSVGVTADEGFVEALTDSVIRLTDWIDGDPFDTNLSEAWDTSARVLADTCTRVAGG